MKKIESQDRSLTEFSAFPKEHNKTNSILSIFSKKQDNSNNPPKDSFLVNSDPFNSTMSKLHASIERNFLAQKRAAEKDTASFEKKRREILEISSDDEPEQQKPKNSPNQIEVDWVLTQNEDEFDKNVTKNVPKPKPPKTDLSIFEVLSFPLEEALNENINLLSQDPDSANDQFNPPNSFSTNDESAPNDMINQSPDIMENQEPFPDPSLLSTSLYVPQMLVADEQQTQLSSGASSLHPIPLVRSNTLSALDKFEGLSTTENENTVPDQDKQQKMIPTEDGSENDQINLLSRRNIDSNSMKIATDSFGSTPLTSPPAQSFNESSKQTLDSQENNSNQTIVNQNLEKTKKLALLQRKTSRIFSEIPNEVYNVPMSTMNKTARVQQLSVSQFGASLAPPQVPQVPQTQQQDNPQYMKAIIQRNSKFWMPDSLAKYCFCCQKLFSVLRRKHHCRLCGQVYCFACASHFIDGDEFGVSESSIRVCDYCIKMLTVRQKYASKLHFGVAGSVPSPISRVNSNPLQKNQPSKLSASGEHGNKRGSVTLLGTSISSRASNSMDERDEHSDVEIQNFSDAVVQKDEYFNITNPEIYDVQQQENEANLDARFLSSDAQKIENCALDHFRNFVEELLIREEKNLRKAQMREYIEENAPNFPKNSKTRQNLKKKFSENYVSPQLLGYKDVVVSLALEAASTVSTFPEFGEPMDLREHIKIKKVPGGNPSDSKYISGIVFTKNLAHKRMNSNKKHARILLLDAPLEYRQKENVLSNFDILLKQEEQSIAMMIQKIVEQRPDFIVVSKNVSQIAKELLLKHGISLLVHVKPKILERLARCTNGDVLFEQIFGEEHIGMSKEVYIKNYSEDPNKKILSGKYFPKQNKKKVQETSISNQETQNTEKNLVIPNGDSNTQKALIHFIGSVPQGGGTILLRGSTREEELRAIKSVTNFAIFAAYNLRLETDLFVLESGTYISAGSNDLETTAIENGNDQVAFKKKKNVVSDKSIMSVSPFVKFELDLDTYITSNNSNISNISRDSMHVNDINSKENGEDHDSENTYEQDHTASNNQEIVIDKRIFSPQFHQHIDLVFMKHSRQLKQFKDDFIKQYHPPSPIRIFYYGKNDTTVGAFLQNTCFGTAKLRKANQLLSGKNLGFDKVRLFFHGSGCVRLTVDDKRKVPSADEDEEDPDFLKIADNYNTNDSNFETSSVNENDGNEEENTIFIQNYCKVCGEFVTLPIAMSENALKYSFGKFLEVTFYNRNLACNSPKCSHSVHHDHVRCFIYKNLIAKFEYKHMPQRKLIATKINLVGNENLTQKNFKLLVQDTDDKLQEVSQNINNSINEKVKALKAKETEYIRKLETSKGNAQDEEKLILKILKCKKLIKDFSNLIAQISYDIQRFRQQLFTSFVEQSYIKDMSLYELNHLLVGINYNFFIWNEIIHEISQKSKKKHSLLRTAFLTTFLKRQPKEKLSAEELLEDVEGEEDLQKYSKKVLKNFLNKIENSKNQTTPDKAAPKEKSSAIEISNGKSRLRTSFINNNNSPPFASTVSTTINSSILPSSSSSYIVNKNCNNVLSNSKKSIIVQFFVNETNLHPISVLLIEKMALIQQSNNPRNSIITNAEILSNYISNSSFSSSSSSTEQQLKQQKTKNLQNNDSPSKIGQIRTSSDPIPNAPHEAENFPNLTLSDQISDSDNTPTTGIQSPEVASKPKDGVESPVAPQNLSNPQNPINSDEEKDDVEGFSDSMSTDSSNSSGDEADDDQIQPEKQKEITGGTEGISQKTATIPKDQSVEKQISNKTQQVSNKTPQKSSLELQKACSPPMFNSPNLANYYSSPNAFFTSPLMDMTNNRFSLTNEESSPFQTTPPVASVPQFAKTAKLQQLQQQNNDIYEARKSTKHKYFEIPDSLKFPMPFALMPSSTTNCLKEIIVHENEPSTIIAFALASKSYLEALKNIPDFESLSTEECLKQKKKFHYSFEFDPTGNSFGGNANSGNPSNPDNSYIFQASNSAFGDSTPSTSFSFKLKSLNKGFSCEVYHAKHFSELRKAVLGEKEEIVNNAFIESLSRCKKWVPKGGKHTQSFTISWDQRFVIKKLSRKESLPFLEEFGYGYFDHMAKVIYNDLPSLIAKILGLYKIEYKSSSGYHIKDHFIVMENVFYGRNITKLFDLKGSTRNRYINEETDKKEKPTNKPAGARKKSLLKVGEQTNTENNNKANAGTLNLGNLAPNEEVGMTLGTLTGTFIKSAISKESSANNGNNEKNEEKKKQSTKLDENYMESIFKGEQFIVCNMDKALLNYSIHNDTLFFAKYSIIDYSLLVGIDQENDELVVGIIDYLRSYSWEKKLETFIKSNSSEISRIPTIIEPKFYKARFRESVEKYFMQTFDHFSCETISETSQ